MALFSWLIWIVNVYVEADESMGGKGCQTVPNLAR